MHSLKSVSIAVLLVVSSVALTACSPDVGSKEWCADMGKKSKADWTATEAKDFAKHCILPK